MMKIAPVVFIFAISALSLNAQATSFSFGCITNNGIGTCDSAEAQISLDVTDTGSDTVLFEFSNNDVGVGTDYGSIIGEVYFYDGVILDENSPVIHNGAGVEFQNDKVNPAELPAYNDTALNVFASADVDQNTADGVAVGDGTLGIEFSLLFGMVYQDVIDALYREDLVIGIHAKALGGAQDVSESLINVVPVPAAVWLFGSGLLSLIAVARRRSR